MAEEQPKYYTIADLAMILKVHANTILRWLNDGTLTGVKICGVWRVRAEDLPKPK